MERRYKYAGALTFALIFALAAASAAPGRYYYEIKIYHLKTKAQEDRLDSYLKGAYLPALHRRHIDKVGVFKTMETDTADKRVYVLIPFTAINLIENLDSELSGDQQYLADGKDYIDAAYDDLPYSRMETIVLKAFPKWPTPTEPQLTAPKPERVYELRSYESPTEAFNVNKVKMFNDGGETVLFKRLNFNAVFYAEVLAGSHMPNLMYMTTFESKADRDKHWDVFGNDPEWKTLVANPVYAHNVSKAEIIFLHPTEYSDF
jgi:hypothetical protein